MPTSLAPIVYVLAFVAVVVLAQAAAGVLFRARDRGRRVNRRLTMLEAGISREQVYASLVRQPVKPRFGGDRLVALHDSVAAYLGQAGLAMTPAQLAGVAAAGAVALWLLGLTMAQAGATHGVILNGLMSAIGACSISAVATWLWLRRLRNARIRKVEEQLPLALDIINRALRAGHPVVSAVQLASDELGDPLGSEFGLIVDETTYGIEFKEALANFARRTGSGDAHFFAVGVSVQSETGGNLAEILEGLAGVMRGRATLAKRVRSVSSEGRASAILLSVLPVLMVGFQLLIHPSVYSDKFSDPIFWPVVVLTLLIYGVGWVMIYRIINFKY
ncbi:type II secretion system F family protein [Phenylobacterium sp.]|uniref:type II secretion system F family protein n=1 Tax=Phenylobacterium sp. TaxID=1871053 RepID=UPI0035AE040D